MLYDVLDISRHIINYSDEKDYGVSNLKLQKLLYFVQGNFLRVLKRACFYEEIEAWKYGPVIPEVYSEFKMFGSNDIPRITHYNYFESNRYRPVQRTFVINLSEDEKKKL